jgi:hypothetical protein
LTEDELVARTDSNYFAVWPLYSSLGDGGGETRQRGALTITDSCTPMANFNNIFVTRPLPADAGAARRHCLFDEPGGVRRRIREGLDPAAERACAAGLVDGGITRHGAAVSRSRAPRRSLITRRHREAFLPLQAIWRPSACRGSSPRCC